MKSTSTALAVLAAVALTGACGKKKARPAAGDDARLRDAATAAPLDAAPAAVDADTRPPPPVLATRVPACDRYQAVLIAGLGCEALAAHRGVLRVNLDTLQRNFAAWPTLPDDQRAAAMKAGGEQCAAAAASLTDLLAGAGCPP